MRPAALIVVAVFLLAGCSIRACSGTRTSKPTPVASLTGSPAAPGTGIAVKLKATASIRFQAGSFSQQYTLDSGTNPANELVLESRQAFLDLGTLNTQDLRVTVIGGAGPGVTLRGPAQVLAYFSDQVAHVGGIATQGQGVCTLALARFGADGLAGNLDCENITPLMGAASPVSLLATINAVPA